MADVSQMTMTVRVTYAWWVAPLFAIARPVAWLMDALHAPPSRRLVTAYGRLVLRGVRVETPK